MTRKDITQRKNVFTNVELAYIKKLAKKEYDEVKGMETIDNKYKQRQNLLGKIIRKVEFYKERKKK